VKETVIEKCTEWLINSYLLWEMSDKTQKWVTNSRSLISWLIVTYLYKKWVTKHRNESQNFYPNRICFCITFLHINLKKLNSYWYLISILKINQRKSK
jgi:hypothetical protein